MILSSCHHDFGTFVNFKEVQNRIGGCLKIHEPQKNNSQMNSFNNCLSEIHIENI